MKKIIFVLVALTGMILKSMHASASDTEYLSEEIVSYTEEIGEIYGICPEFIQAIIEKESCGDPKAKNENCIGLMQIYKRYHNERMDRLGVSDLYDPYSNILVGTDYIAELFEEYEDPYLVLMVYNMGSSKAISRYEAGKYSKYAVSICDRSAELEGLHGKLN